MSAIKRVFLGWRQAAVLAAAEYLADRYTADGLLDLTPVTVVTPSRRSGRRLREVLLELADQRQLGFFPPTLTTIGGLPELLYPVKRPFASPLVQQFAWAQALRSTSKAALGRLIPRAPQDSSDPRWMELAGVLQRQHLELAAHRLDFHGVAQRGRKLEGFTDLQRWLDLAGVQQQYLRTLDDLGLWDRQTARNYAVQQQECSFDGQLVLLGCVDLTATLRAMLQAVASQTTALIYADQRIHDRYDAFGGVNPEAWQSAPLGVKDHHLLIADGPSQQADAVVHAIDRLEGKYSAADITIGVPDATLVPHLENTLQQFGLQTRWGPGRSLSASRPAQWLRVAAEYLSGQRYSAMAELVRLDDTVQFLAGQKHFADTAKDLDRYFERHLPDVIPWDDPGLSTPLPDGVRLVQDLLSPLRGAAATPGQWGQAIRAVLVRLYERRQIRPHDQAARATVAACDQLGQAIERLTELPESLAPRVTASAAILMLLSQLDEEVPPPSDSGQIDMLGWLDLPLDDAKVVIVTSMNDGTVPGTVSSDVFLPNALRQALGVDDNAQRYARDAQTLQVLLESRMVVRLVIGRRTASNDPLRPSRLVMATARAQLPARCQRLFSGRASFPPLSLSVEREEAAFEVPRPTTLWAPIESLSVSDFARYLTCPYRFFLLKAQRLKPKHDQHREIDAASFGSLAHEALERFGLSDCRDSQDADQIREFLLDELARLAAAKYGSQPQPTVQVQLAMLRQRLETFALRQVEWRKQGWRIISTEFAEDHAQFMVDDEPQRLRGRIDRIDHRVLGGEDEYAVLDYKTSESATSPAKKHVPKVKPGLTPEPEDWKDLQLPLYRHLLKSMPEIRDHRHIRLGYVSLPAAAADAGFVLANWTAEDLESADEAAADVVRQIRAGIFWPPADPYPYPQDDMAAIVQEGVFGRADFLATAQLSDATQGGEQHD